MEVGHYKIGAIIQARLGSKRLPNKVLMPLGGNDNTIISQIISQLKKVEQIEKIIVASSLKKANDLLETYVLSLNTECFRGSEDDVLSRFSHILKNNSFDYVLRFTSDNPVVDIKYLKEFINNVLTKELDYSYSQNLPLGCNFEMIKANLITDAHQKTTKSYDKEHVTPYVKRTAKKQELYNFKIDTLFSKLRLTIDYPSDYSFVFLISCLLKDQELNINNIYKLVSQNLWLLNINNDNYQKKEYLNLEEEIADLLPIVKEREFKRIEKLLLNVSKENNI
ncbi:cytidylyltransferase domain-containing protein [Mesoflavibacter sp. SCSIO 43206]|uniref:cytidylyltransferase domain-containing protein n=1 Tax=Mesoflavibacter sp. SCSIO 43206 TaxID=2779362 RepID=UPI001CA894F2|nr:hypothetical protein [Mesoflavibacter sp. SCSIO 43206]UAB76415.1 hypothetical protein INR78_05325 [Mesoflavibacter sp. SCSIO 43206]